MRWQNWLWLMTFKVIHFSYLPVVGDADGGEPQRGRVVSETVQVFSTQVVVTVGLGEREVAKLAEHVEAAFANVEVLVGTEYEHGWGVASAVTRWGRETGVGLLGGRLLREAKATMTLYSPEIFPLLDDVLGRPEEPLGQGVGEGGPVRLFCLLRVLFRLFRALAAILAVSVFLGRFLACFGFGHVCWGGLAAGGIEKRGHSERGEGSVLKTRLLVATGSSYPFVGEVEEDGYRSGDVFVAGAPKGDDNGV